MIVTVTANPALDLTYVLSEQLDLNTEVHRAGQATMEASGKGVNVSRALRAAGADGCAVLPVGGATGRYLEELLDRDGLPARTVRQEDSTRVNTTVLQPDGHTLKVNGPGPALSASAQDALVGAVTAMLTESTTHDEIWLAICGSLPPQASASLVTRLVQAAHAAGARCAVDTSGPALAAAFEAGADLLAPNRAELAEVDPGVAQTGSDVRDLAPVVTDLAAQRGCELLVSMGSEGALWSDGRRTLHGHGPTLQPVNSAGAGDALLAGWLAGPGDPADRLSRAVRWGRSACLAPTTVDPSPGSGDPVPPVVEELVVTAGETQDRSPQRWH